MPETDTRTLSELSVEELREASDNPRRISPDRFRALCHALRSDPDMLRARPIIATPDGVVVAGNMRLRAAKAIGMETVPVFLAELDAARRREWMLRDNASYGDWVPDRLAELVSLHEREGGDVSLLGLSAQEAADMTALEERSNASGLDEPPDPGAAIEPRFAVVVECADEPQQSRLLEAIEGLDESFAEVRAILV